METSDRNMSERDAFLKSEQESKQFYPLAEEIIYEARKLGRPLNAFDIPSLAALIKSFLRREEGNRQA